MRLNFTSILAVTSWLGCLLTATSATAYSEHDLLRLTTTGDCPACDLTNINVTLSVALKDVRGANLEQAQIRAGRIEEANFQGANLRHAKIFSEIIVRSKFDDADLTGASFAPASSHGTPLMFQQNSLVRTKMVDASLKDVICYHSVIAGADMTRLRVLVHTMWRKCDVEGGTADQSEWKGMLYSQTFNGTSLRDAHFMLAKFSSVSFPSADLRGARIYSDGEHTDVRFSSTTMLGGAVVNGVQCGPQAIGSCTP